MKPSAKLIVCLLMSTPLAVCANAAPDKPGVTDRAGEESSSFQIRESTQVPGHTLKPGSYNIRIVDHLSDRMILRVERDGKLQATFLGLPSQGQSASGPIMLTSGAGAKAALKGYAFGNGTVAEFVYPKAEAVGLAKANGTRIPAIDPASEGRPADNNLSPEDYQLVTLWLLSPTTVGPDAKSGILAQRYHAPEAAQQASEPKAQPVRASSGDVGVETAYATTAPRASGADTQNASVRIPARPMHKARPVMTVLPHTAGSMPLVWLAGLLALLSAVAMTGRRWLRGE